MHDLIGAPARVRALIGRLNSRHERVRPETEASAWTRLDMTSPVILKSSGCFATWCIWTQLELLYKYAAASIATCIQTKNRMLPCQWLRSSDERPHAGTSCA
jgi:hypothetical protein